MAPTATYQTEFQTEFEVGKVYPAAAIKVLIFKHFPQQLEGELEGLADFHVNSTQYNANSFTLDQALPDARPKIVLPRSIKIREERDVRINSMPTVCFTETLRGYVCDGKKSE